jgi:uncharacterized protein (DUF1800 family)
MPAALEYAWAPYTSAPGEPWNLRRVVHLHRRAGLGATWAEVERDLADGPAAAVNRLLEGKRTEGVPEDFEHRAGLLADAATATGDIARLKSWWLWRMLFTPDPLGERLTLAWHDHFATSQLKVMDVAAMHAQNELFRRFARAPFGELLGGVVHDPALLRWLDAQSNRAEHPNENLARELMELFTLGVGNYGERDVKEAARALTGWYVTADGRFYESAEHHDAGTKTILGRTGNLRGDDLVALLLEQPAAARRLAGRLCELFLREELRSGAALESLAGELRAHALDIGHGVALVLRSRLFFSEANLGGVVLGPAQFLVGAARALELLEPPPRMLLLAEWCARLGQDLFFPPNVFGWEGGRAWISTGTLLGRARFATELSDGSLGARGASAVDALARLHAADDPRRLGAFLERLFLGVESEAAHWTDASTGAALDRARVVARFLSSPEAQLG